MLDVQFSLFRTDATRTRVALTTKQAGAPRSGCRRQQAIVAVWGLVWVWFASLRGQAYVAVVCVTPRAIPFGSSLVKSLAPSDMAASL